MTAAACVPVVAASPPAVDRAQAQENEGRTPRAAPRGACENPFRSQSTSALGVRGGYTRGQPSPYCAQVGTVPTLGTSPGVPAGVPVVTRGSRPGAGVVRPCLPLQSTIHTGS
jgi:hypothetical protein